MLYTGQIVPLKFEGGLRLFALFIYFVCFMVYYCFLEVY